MATIEIDYARLARRAEEFGFRRGEFVELKAGLLLAAELTGQTMATPESITWIDSLTGITGWVTGSPVDGIFISVPLTEAGVGAVRDGSFVPGWPSLAHVCCEGEACAGVYIGVYAGANKDARRRVMMAAGVIRVDCFAAVPCFARGATEDGKRSMASLGFQPIEGGLSDLWGQEPLAAGQIVTKEDAA
ncbi:hypothetical protein K1X12_13735 [Hyphomonas sp. WL0036]|uniref:hypothetical protein n=1 Tax=Hyphomonas sediminis TaxID=2866160 RepID=UPI001C81FA11|nr:hypothetical protein [Hyphomonas sediminis]MBY9067967.1 hypothetical protein [Hyphomonas sediminis]